MSKEKRVSIDTLCNKVGRSPGGFEGANYTSYDDCFEQTERFLLSVNRATYLFAAIWFLYCIYVVNKHYRRADLPENDGGCPKEGGSGMFRIERRFASAEEVAT